MLPFCTPWTYWVGVGYGDHILAFERRQTIPVSVRYCYKHWQQNQSEDSWNRIQEMPRRIITVLQLHCREDEAAINVLANSATLGDSAAVRRAAWIRKTRTRRVREARASQAMATPSSPSPSGERQVRRPALTPEEEAAITAQVTSER